MCQMGASLKFIFFFCLLHDWELEFMDLFLKDLYTAKIRHSQEDRMIWTLSKAQGLKVVLSTKH